MRPHVLAFLCVPILTLPIQAQWDLQESHTTASLRGIHHVGGGVAWASGTNGTVLRTEDSGDLWQSCAVPPGAEKLDFRGIAAFDENTAIVMSSGKGDRQALYAELLACLYRAGAECVQIDEPCLCVDLNLVAQSFYREAFTILNEHTPLPKLMLTTYFGDIGNNLDLALGLDTEGLHLDLVRARAVTGSNCKEAVSLSDFARAGR